MMLTKTYVYDNIFSQLKRGVFVMIREYMLELGYSDTEVRMMTVSLPSLYGLSIENIRIKKEFYDSIGLSRLMIVDPKKVMQSIELSYSRYMFFKDIGIDINMGNYRVLFDSQKRFENRYGKNNKTLIELYKFNGFVNKNCKCKKRVK